MESTATAVTSSLDSGSNISLSTTSSKASVAASITVSATTSVASTARVAPTTASVVSVEESPISIFQSLVDSTMSISATCEATGIAA